MLDIVGANFDEHDVSSMLEGVGANFDEDNVSEMLGGVGAANFDDDDSIRNVRHGGAACVVVVGISIL